MHGARNAMSDDLNTEIKITASADGVEAGVGRAKRSLADLSQAADKAGEQGGKGLGKIGAGGEGAARKVEASTKNMVASLQRQIAALDAGGTATRQYQESLARLRGADMTALKPYLDQLDAAKVKAESAARAQGGLEMRLGTLGGVADVVRGQLIALAGSVTLGAMFAFVKNVNDGVDALNDIKDATGATIENISALEQVALRTGGSLDLVGSVLIKFNDVLSKATPKSDMALALESIGLKAEELRKLDPAEALRQTAVALSGYADDANKARLVQELFGKSVKDAAPFLADLAEKGALVGTVLTSQADEADRFNKQLFEIQTYATNAARAIAGPLVAGINEAVKAFRDGSAAGEGFWETAWKRYQQNVYRLHGMPEPKAPSAGGTTGSWEEPEAPKPSVPAPKSATEIAAAASAAKKAAEDLRRELGEQAKLVAELHGLSGSFAEDWARLSKVYTDKSGVVNMEALAAAQAKLLEKQPAIKAAADAEKKMLEELAKASQLVADARNKEADGITAWFQQQQAAAEQSLRSVTDRVAALQTEEAAVTLATSLNISLAEAIERVAIERMREKQAGFIEGSEGWQAIEREIAARKELLGLVSSKAQREDEARGWADMWQSVDRTAHDVFVNVLEGGQDAFKRLGNTLKASVLDVLYQMTVRKWIINIGTSVFGAGFGAAAQAATGGGVGGALSTAGGIGNMASLASGIGSFTTAGMLPAGLATALTGSTSSLAMGLSGAWGAGGGMLSTLNAGASMIGSGSIMSGLGTLAGALGPIALGIAALAAIFGKKATPHAGAASTYSEAGGLVSGADIYRASGLADVRTYNAGVEQVTGNVAKAIGDTLNATAKAFGQTAGYEISTAFADDASKDGAWGSLIIKQMGAAIVDWRDTQTSKWAPREFADGEAGSKEYLAAVAKSTRDALVQAIGSVDWATDMLKGLGDSVSLESLAQTVQQINAAQAAFDALGKNIVGFGALTDGAISALVKAAGSIDGLVSAASAYYENFYSEAEKTANVTRDVAAALADVGLAMPTTRDEFRALVEEQMALGEAGAPAVAALLGVSGAFAAITPAAEAAVAAVAAASASFLQTFTLPEPVNGQWHEEAVEPLNDAWKSLLESIVASTVTAQNELARLGMNSYERALAEIDDRAQQALKELQGGGYMAAEQTQLAEAKRIAVRDAAFADMFGKQIASGDAQGIAVPDYVRTGYDTFTQSAAQAADDIARLTDVLGAVPPEILAMVEAEKALLEARSAMQAGALVDGLQKEMDRLGFTALERELAGISDRADDYIKSLRDLGQGTDANIAAVQAWEEAMRAAAQTGGGAAGNVRQRFEDAYKTQLGRAADTAGLEYWTAAVASGTMTIESALAAFADGATGEKLSNRILELTDAEGYLAQMRENELSLLSETNRPLQERIWALEEEARISQERTSLQDTLNQLTMTSTELRALEIAKLDESNRPLQERINLLQDEKRIAEERNGLMTSLYQALGNTGALRADQLANLDPANRALQEQVWQIEDAKAALEKALQAEQESANAAQQAASERVNTLKSIFDALKSNVDSLYDSVEATKAWTAAQANAFIDNALGNARATGYMPESDDLADAISGARAGLDKPYATEFEKQRDALVLAGKLAELQGISGEQLTAAERQLKAAEAQVEALDGMQAQGKAMLESLSGNVTATLSVRDAMLQLSAAVLGAQAAASAQAGQTLASVRSTTDQFSNGTSANRIYGGSGSIILDVGNDWSQQRVADQIKSNLAIFGARTDKSDYEALLAYARSKGIPGFAVGTNYVPKDMLAQIHEGEAIVPKAYNPAAGGMQSNARLEALIEGLTARVQALQSELVAIKTNTSNMAENLDEVTEGGNAMRSRAVGVTA